MDVAILVCVCGNEPHEWVCVCVCVFSRAESIAQYQGIRVTSELRVWMLMYYRNIAATINKTVRA